LGKHVPHPADKPKETEPKIMFNKVLLVGRLGQNAEAKTAQNNREYVVLNIATQESWKNDKGDYETRTEWHRVYAWRNLSKFAKTLQKGQLITLEGTFPGFGVYAASKLALRSFARTWLDVVVAYPEITQE
jgi:Single-strand binding protein family